MKWLIVALLLAGLVITVARGPRPELDPTRDRERLTDPIDSALAASEARYADIVPGVEKRVIWADSPDSHADWSLVYLHGFSATSRETTPLTETLSERLSANAFLTRLSGHGRGSEALSNVDGSEWFADTREALDIGGRIGKRVAVIGVSTGATLAAWLATEPAPEQLGALVFISPNFAIADRSSNVLNWPWGLKTAELILGPERSFETVNDDHATYWTTSYRLHPLGELMALVKLVSERSLSDIAVPVLYIRSDRDRVIDMDLADEIFDDLPNPANKRYIVTNSDDPYGHVIAGDILSPSTTQQVADVIAEWLEGLPPQ